MRAIAVGMASLEEEEEQAKLYSVRLELLAGLGKQGFTLITQRTNSNKRYRLYLLAGLLRKALLGAIRAACSKRGGALLPRKALLAFGNTLPYNPTQLPVCA